MGDLESRTFAMNPQKATRRIPLLKGAAEGEPHCRCIANTSARIHLIFRWVWRGKPTSRALVQSVTYGAGSPFVPMKSG